MSRYIFVGVGGVTGMSAILFPEGGGASVQVYGTLLQIYSAFFADILGSLAYVLGSFADI